MLVASPPPQPVAIEGGQQRRPSQWDAFNFTQLGLELEEVPRTHVKPRRSSSLKILTQEESLAHFFIPKRRKLMTTMTVISAFLDLLKQVREKRGQVVSDEHIPKTDEDLANTISNLGTESPTSVKSLRFDVIEVRQYETILDVNPGSAKGPAVGIGWRYRQSDPLSVDEYESTRPPRRRVGKDYRPLTSKQRTELLKKQGYTDKQLEDGIKATDEARKKRRKTFEDLKRHRGVDKSAERMEQAAVVLQRFTHLRRSSDAEIEQLWKKANSPKKLGRKCLSFNNRHDKKKYH